MLRMFCVTAAVAAVVSTAVLAQSRRDSGRSADDWCGDQSHGRMVQHCEVRESTIPGVNPLDVDAGTNGGIRIRGWDRGDVLVRARIAGWGETEADARRIVSGIRIDTSGNSVRAVGPDQTSGDDGWSVSFEIQAPRTAMLTLRTRNGGISIDDFRGTAKFRATNGGVKLSNVGGDIRGETTNGGVNVDLAGDHWDGAGLDVETQNGGVHMSLPASYSAALETGTVNGRVSIDFPVMLQGRIGRHIETTLGSGGAKIRAVTTNGGVTIRRQ